MSLQKWSEGIWVMTLAAEPAMSDDLDTLLEQVGAAQSSPHVVIDLSGVRRMNSSNLSALLRVRKVLVQGDAKLLLAEPTDEIWAVFLVTGLDKAFDFVPHVSTALAGLSLPPEQV